MQEVVRWAECRPRSRSNVWDCSTCQALGSGPLLPRGVRSTNKFYAPKKAFRFIARNSSRDRAMPRSSPGPVSFSADADDVASPVTRVTVLHRLRHRCVDLTILLLGVITAYMMWEVYRSNLSAGCFTGEISAVSSLNCATTPIPLAMVRAPFSLACSPAEWALVVVGAVLLISAITAMYAATVIAATSEESSHEI